jgi:hypothetical protein
VGRFFYAFAAIESLRASRTRNRLRVSASQLSGSRTSVLDRASAE